MLGGGGVGIWEGADGVFCFEERIFGGVKWVFGNRRFSRWGGGGGVGVWVMVVAEARAFLAGGGVLFERRHSVGEVGKKLSFDYWFLEKGGMCLRVTVFESLCYRERGDRGSRWVRSRKERAGTATGTATGRGGEGDRQEMQRI